jgi:succinate dehydrogenase hydrophobic anchor subunit
MIIVHKQDLQDYATRYKNESPESDNMSNIEGDETCENITAVVLIVLTIIAVIFLFWLQNSKYHLSVIHGNIYNQNQ